MGFSRSSRIVLAVAVLSAAAMLAIAFFGSGRGLSDLELFILTSLWLIPSSALSNSSRSPRDAWRCLRRWLGAGARG